jgi:hypothetical protein
MKPVKLLIVTAAILACGRPAADPQAKVEASEPRGQRDTASGRSPAEDGYLISRAGIGGVRLGMTLAEARRALPTATFARATDGDGVALIKVTLAPEQALTLWADEDDPAAAIDWTKTVRTIETFSSAFRTAEGVHPGAAVSEVESVYGTTRMIEMSEIESRQYIFFARQPDYLTLRLNYTGIFRDGARSTTEVGPDAKIMSIAVSSY